MAPTADQRLIKARLVQLRYMGKAAKVLADIRALRTQIQGSDAQQAADQSRAPRIQYDAIGRLVPSAVYDGQRLPMLYRLIAPEDGATVGYVRPNETVRSTHCLGRIVSIVGKPRFDPALKLHIIEPRQIDVRPSTTLLAPAPADTAPAVGPDLGG